MSGPLKLLDLTDKWQQADCLFEYANSLPEERRKSHWLALANAIDYHNEPEGEDPDELLDAAMSLLAFRLRDEVVKNDQRGYWLALEEIRREWDIKAGLEGTVWLDKFLAFYAKPIHFIVAALEAQQLAIEKE